jgi:putative membrane protein
MKKPILHWLLSTLAIWIVSQTVPGFVVSGVFAALFAALVIGFVNGTLGAVLKFVTLPLTIITLGLFWFVINALMIELASVVIPGFHLESFASAFWGGIVLTIVNTLLKLVV